MLKVVKISFCFHIQLVHHFFPSSSSYLLTKIVFFKIIVSKKLKPRIGVLYTSVFYFKKALTQALKYLINTIKKIKSMNGLLIHNQLKNLEPISLSGLDNVKLLTCVDPLVVNPSNYEQELVFLHLYLMYRTH